MQRFQTYEEKPQKEDCQSKTIPIARLDNFGEIWRSKYSHLLLTGNSSCSSVDGDNSLFFSFLLNDRILSVHSTLLHFSFSRSLSLSLSRFLVRPFLPGLEKSLFNYVSSIPDYGRSQERKLFIDVFGEASSATFDVLQLAHTPPASPLSIDRWWQITVPNVGKSCVCSSRTLILYEWCWLTFTD